MFETEEARKQAADIHRDITNGDYDGIDKNGYPIRDNYDGTHQVLGSDGKWRTRRNDYHDRPDDD